MKHAFLIMAHNEWGILQKLVSLLDDERNDIFIHIDKKVNCLPSIKTEKSVARFVPDDKRVDVIWGRESQVVADLTLLEYAHSYGAYEYYHLISGVDLPIKSNDYIHDFFSCNCGKEFVGFMPYNKNNDYDERLKYWHFFLPSTRQHNLKKYIPQLMHSLLLMFQKVLHVKRRYDFDIRKGEVWVSISEQFARYVLSKKECVFKDIRYTFCVDELLWQTLIWNSPFRDNIFSLESDHYGCMREIDWKRGMPYTWGRDQGDFELLMHSNRIFARKFSSKYLEIVEKVYAEVKRKNEENSLCV